MAKKKNPKDKMSEAFYVRFTPSEAKILRRVFKENGFTSVSAFIAEAAMDRAQSLS